MKHKCCDQEITLRVHQCMVGDIYLDTENLNKGYVRLTQGFDGDIIVEKEKIDDLIAGLLEYRNKPKKTKKKGKAKKS